MNMHRSRGFLPLFALVLFAGCATLPPVSKFQSEYHFTVRGHVTEDQVKTLDYILSRLPPAMIASVREIAVQPPEHFRSGTVAHFNSFPCGPIICFQPSNINDAGIVWHETGHAYEYKLDLECEDYSNGFTAKWVDVAGKVYVGRANWEKQSFLEYPQRGLLTTYSSVNNLEDLAEWVENVYLYLTGRNSALYELKEKGGFKEDRRYGQKLKLLNQYGFLNDDDYQTVLDFLK